MVDGRHCGRQAGGGIAPGGYPDRLARHSRPALSLLGQDRRGATIIEFAMIAPVMGLLLTGAFDLSHTLYTRAMLQGIVQKAARDSTLETSSEQATQVRVDAMVANQAKALHNGADIAITRRFYRNFSQAAAARAEAYTDTNRDGQCNAGEPFEDTNGNGVWDRDGGNAGQGGAKDATLYTVTMRYPRIMPVARFVGLSDTQTVTAQTVLRNQPYGDQDSYAAPVVRNCP